MTAKQTKIIAFGVVLMLALGCAAWFFGIAPQMEKAAAHKAATVTSQQTTATLQSTLTSLQQKQTELDNASGAYRQLSRQFPESFDGSAWVAMMLDAASQTGVGITTITPSIPTVSTPGTAVTPAAAPVPGTPGAPPVAADPSAMLASSSVMLNVGGTAQQIRAFVKAVGLLDRPLLVTSVNITTAEGKATAEIAGTTYLMRSLPEPGSAAAQAEADAAVPVDPAAPLETPVP